MGDRGTKRARYDNPKNGQNDHGWRQWHEVTIRVYEVPRDTTTLDLFEVFSTFGRIQAIEISRRQEVHTVATITYSPPPKLAFWERKNAKGRMELLPLKRSFFYPSPVSSKRFYPESTTLIGESLNFGFMYNEHEMMTMKAIQSVTEDSLAFSLDMLRLKLDIKFSCNIKISEADQGVDRDFRFFIPLNHLERIFEVKQNDERLAIIIPLNYPPAFYRRLQDVSISHDDSSSHWSEYRAWYRQTDILHENDRADLKRAPITLRKSKAVIDIGRWKTYRFVFRPTKCNRDAYAIIRQALVDYNCNIVNVDNFSILNEEEANIWKWIDLPRGKDDDAAVLQALDSEWIHLPFPIRYQMEVCLSHGYLNEHNITRNFVNQLANMDTQSAKAILEKVADAKLRYYDPMLIFNLKVRKFALNRQIPSYCTFVRAANITPSMIYYETPLVETSNRVVRQYIELEDRFLRVKFTDEKSQGRINSQSDNSFDEVFTRIKRAMTNGITLGDRTYEFLAFGNSQFREHGAYFFAPTNYLSTDDIRQWMGDFSSIKTVAKWAARLGQCFSTTRAINGTRVTVRPIEDIKRGKYNFTDGVGKISHFLAQMVAAEFGLPNAYNDPPSLFQFRLGGCKGVLVLAPEVKKQEIYIRRSQYKFPAKHEGLEIVRYSAFAASTLNRQIILVLSMLGVRDEVFRAKLQNMLSDLKRALSDSSVALSMLQKNIDFNQMTLVMASMILDGFMASKEPFLMSLLELWRAWNIKYLKEKAKIWIEKGAFLLGCVDETATLRGHYNAFRPKSVRDVKSLPEIFVQVSIPQSKGAYKVIEGVCLLARNPSLHPGDIRVVNAVNVPALHHLKDVIVLPQTGDRDVANMCSGGDLDGDDYLVMWDQELLPTIVNYPAMNYEPQRAQKLSRTVTVDDVTSFFVTYMKNDRLGTIATAHLAHGDSSPEGIKCDKCIRLASLHSDAVDYPKSGIPANMSRDLRPRRWPHFMERKNPRDTIYQSKKILGQLYDMVERADFVPQYQNAPDERILRAYDLNDDILVQAAELKESYDAAIRRVMAQHSIRTEFEIWSTFVLEHNQGSKDYKFHEELGNISRSIRDHYRDKCIKKAGGRDFTKLGPFVAAMYTVTAQELAMAVGECAEKRDVNGMQIPIRIMDARHMPFISFPWLFYSELGKIAIGSSNKTSKSKDISRADGRELEIQMRQKSRLRQADNTANIDLVKDELEVGEAVTHRGDLLELFDDALSKSQTEDWNSALKSQDSHDFERRSNFERQQLSIHEKSLLDSPDITWSEASRQVDENNSDMLSLTVSNRAMLLAKRDSARTDTKSVAEANTASRARRKTLARNLLIDIDNEDPDGAPNKSKENAGAMGGISKPLDTARSKAPTLMVQTSVSTPSTNETYSGSVVSCDSKISSLDGEAIALVMPTAKSGNGKLIDKKEEYITKTGKSRDNMGKKQSEIGEESHQGHQGDESNHGNVEDTDNDDQSENNEGEDKP